MKQEDPEIQVIESEEEDEEVMVDDFSNIFLNFASGACRRL